MGSIVLHQDQQKSLRGSYYYQNLPISLCRSSVNLPYLQQRPPLLPLPQIPITKAPPKTQPKVPARARSQSLFTPKKSRPPSLNRSSQLENKRMGRRVSDKHIMRSVSEGASRGATMDDYSGFIFLVSPHPSSLPLPNFPLPARAKAGGTCKTDAGIDDGVTTDGLRRLLRLR